jgi:hypothetical protein
VRDNIPAPAAAPTPEATVATIDTIELFVRRPPAGLRSRLREAQGASIGWKPYRRAGQFWGARVTVNRPNRATIGLMARLVRDRSIGCTVKRVDVAVDFSVEDYAEADAMAWWLYLNVKLKWRSPRGRKRRWDQDPRYLEGDEFWALWSGGHASRDLCVYVEGCRVRMEVRFQKPTAVRRAGLDRLDQIENLEVQRIVDHNIKAERITERRIISITRRTHKEDMVRHRARRMRQSYPVVDYYRSRIPARTRRILTTAIDMHETKFERGTENITMDLNIPERVMIPEGVALQGKGKFERVGDSGVLLRKTKPRHKNEEAAR